MTRFPKLSWMFRIELLLLALFLLGYEVLGAKVAAMDDATRILGGEASPEFWLTLIYLIWHFTLIVMLPCYVALRITGFCWEKCLKEKSMGS